jgi:xylan 1,4-beta-xylosidase
MFGMMSGKRVEVVSNRAYDLRTAVDSSFRKSHPDINALACKDAHAATVMLWNYHDDDIKDSAANVEINIKGIPAKQVQLYHYRIDDQFSNSYEAWKKMGSPQSPSPGQIADWEKSGQLQLYTSPQWLNTNNGEALIKMKLPRQAVALLKLDW